MSDVIELEKVICEALDIYFDPYSRSDSKHFREYYEKRMDVEWHEEDRLLDVACNDLSEFLAQFVMQEGDRYKEYLEKHIETLNYLIERLDEHTEKRGLRDGK